MNNKERNKRLGQYFTSPAVAKLLTELALSVKSDISKAIDPMMGEGVFLRTINDVSPNVVTYGIELDTMLADRVNPNFMGKSKLFFGNAFDPKTIQQLPGIFDLVITNPPYVRHLNQINETALEDGSLVPSGVQVKSDLYRSIEKNPNLNKTERTLLLEAASKYSGLSDLSVPSIILCASLTKPDGVLALLIPESCITREYSITTLNVLFKLFDIKLIVKDEGRNWFDDAQVKTLLIVGHKRKNPRSNILSHKDIPVIEIAESTPDHPLGKLSDKLNLKEFTNLFLHPNGVRTVKDIGIKYHRTVTSFLVNALTESNVKIYPEFKQILDLKGTVASLDPRLASLTRCSEYFRFESMSIGVHQGLRTGANNFFYCDLIKKGKDKSLVSMQINGKKNEFDIPSEVLRPVLRKQKEVLGNYLISSKNLTGRLIDLKNNYTASDVSKYQLGADANVLPQKFSEYVDYCSKVNIGTEDKPKFLPQLSAVKTNISTGNGTIRTWYQLPELKERHIPDICIPRVNSNSVNALLVEKGTVVDANFITLNIPKDIMINKYGVLALLSSDWAKVQLELNGNVLGGGALKLDRGHLQNLIFSNKVMSNKNQLEQLGKNLTESLENEAILRQINDTVNDALAIEDSLKLKALLQYRLKLRKKNA